MMININNRRYIGCKTKLLNNIQEVVEEEGYDNSNSFADLFAGTGVVGAYFAKLGYKTLLNDTLYSNYIAYNAWLGNEKIDIPKMQRIICEFNEIESIKLDDNYLSKIYGDKYFSMNDAKKIGYIRDRIEELKNDLNYREICYLVTSLLYATDRIANTVGHYESFLHKKCKERGIKMEMLDIFNITKEVELFNEDANIVSKGLNYDIVYLDPPYNARQYVNFYHVLENIARWNKPTVFEGNSMKFKRNELKSDYCRNKAPELLSDLVNNLNSKLIVVSYNNTYSAKSDSSNNKISEEQLYNILSQKGDVKIKEYDYSFFNAGKTNFNNHKEMLYVCKVK